MVNFFARTLLLSLFYSLTFTGFCQNYTSKESAIVTPDHMHEFFHPTPDRYLVFNYGGMIGVSGNKQDINSTMVTGYDRNLRQIYSVSIKELQGTIYLGGIEFNGHLYIFFSDNRKVYKSEIDAVNGTLATPPEEAFNVGTEFFSFFKGFSRDSSYCYVLVKSHDQKAKDVTYNGAVMDKKMKVLTRFSFLLEGLKDYIATTTCILSQTPTIRVVSTVRVRSDKHEYNPLQYLITDINVEGKAVTSQITGFPEGLLNGVVWTASENGLYFTGLLAKTKKTGFTTIISGEFEASQKKLANIRQTELSTCSALQNPTEKYLKELAKEGLPSEVELAGSYTLSDNSIVLILQQTQVMFTTRGNFSYYDTKARNLYVVKIKPDKTPEWVEVIPNSQTEPTQPLYSGIISGNNGKGDIYIFFHDNVKNEQALRGGDRSNETTLGTSWKYNNLVAVCIHKDGTINKKIIISDDAMADYLLAPGRPFTVYNNEIIYTSYNLARLLGKSTYHIGMIKIN